MREHNGATEMKVAHVVDFIVGTRDQISTKHLPSICYGRPHVLTWDHPKIGAKVFRQAFENMGGRQFKCFCLETNAVATKKRSGGTRFEDMPEEDIDAGFQYIKDKGPRSSSNLQQLTWRTKNIVNKNSPIFGWHSGLVQEALRNLATDGCFAMKEYGWCVCLTRKYYQPWALDILEQVRDFDVSALVMLGEPRAGKSPIGRSIIMAQCRWNKERLGQGSVLMGDFLDDGGCNALSMKVLKSFTDVGLYESMSWARWGAANWVQNQPRIIADQFYDPTCQPKEDVWPEIEFKDFAKMVRPAVPDKTTDAELDAIFNRAAFIMNSKTYRLYLAFKGGNRDPPSTFKANPIEEKRWVSRILDKRIGERKAAVDAEGTGASTLFEGPAPAAVPARVAVKRELDDETFQEFIKKKSKLFASLKTISGSISIDTDSEDDVALPVPAFPEDEDVFGFGGGMDNADA
ncbi:unnamed protein product [Prorocentrum cordatum]|uniref:Uncharacterized protein n=1 Tax=Prorocentrum cordatum TaxID=2364126 RepID=A0ABN9TS99_9DINO|nr:unnamed protein product [Polarella glacialis]